MSELPPNSENNATAEVTTAAIDAKAEIGALIEGVKSQKLTFDETVSTSTSTLSAEIEKAKTASQEATAAKDETVSSKQTMEAERTDFVTKTKAALAEIETTRSAIATIKGGVEATQTSVTSDAGIVSQSKADVEKLRAAATALSEKLAQEHEDVEKQLVTLKKTKDSLENVLKEVADIKTATDKDREDVNKCLGDVTATKERFTALSSEADTAQANLVARQNALQGKITEIEDANVKIVELRRRLLESSEGARSVQDEISALHTEISDVFKEVSDHRASAAKALDELTEKAKKDAEAFTKKQVESFGDLYANLKATIESLLPSAGAAGLSSTYYDAKSRYAPTSFSGKPGGARLKGFWGGVRKAFGYNPASIVATVVFYAMFIVPIVLIVWIFFDFLHDLPKGPKPIDVDYKLLLLRVFIALPLAAISGFGFNSLRRYRNLYEEYNHKQRVMELYISFGREIQASGTPEQKQALLNIMLNSVATKALSNAKETDSDHTDELSLSTLDKFTGTLTKIKSLVT